MSSLIRFEGVHKAYDGRTLVVRDLTLAVEPGEFLSVLGPSGSGKTTLLMMLAGFEQPTDGEIYLAGRPVTRYRRISATSASCFSTSRCFGISPCGRTSRSHWRSAVATSPKSQHAWRELSRW